MLELQLEPSYNIKRIDDPIYPCRVYEYEGRVYPSATSVLSILDDSNWYDEWVKRVGVEKAEAITRVAAERGTSIHEACQKFICNGMKPTYLMPDDIYRFNLIKKELKKLGVVRAVEHKLISEKYQIGGTADLIAYQGNQLTVFDYKTSNNPKKEEDFQSFWYQTAIYAEAWNEKHPEELVSQLGIIPVNNLEMTVKPCYLPLEYVKSDDLLDIRNKFRERFGL